MGLSGAFTTHLQTKEHSLPIQLKPDASPRKHPTRKNLPHLYPMLLDYLAVSTGQSYGLIDLYYAHTPSNVTSNLYTSLPATLTTTSGEQISI